MRIYWRRACIGCAIKARCTTGHNKRIRRWEYVAVAEKVQQRLDRTLNAMKVRKSTIEHVFEAPKHWMDWTHYLTRGMRNVATEMSLHVLAYNLERVIQILGIHGTTKAMRLVGA